MATLHIEHFLAGESTSRCEGPRAISLPRHTPGWQNPRSVDRPPCPSGNLGVVSGTSPEVLSHPRFLLDERLYVGAGDAGRRKRPQVWRLPCRSGYRCGCCCCCWWDGAAVATRRAHATACERSSLSLRCLPATWPPHSSSARVGIRICRGKEVS